MLTQSRLKQVLHYDPKTGIFTRIKSGKEAGGLWCSKKARVQYIQIRIDGKMHKAHRLAFLYMKGSWPKWMIDHKDENGLNNRWKNLREATRTENYQNVSKYSNNTSGEKNVYFHKRTKTWDVIFGIAKKLHHFGCFKTFEEAAAVAQQKRIELHGQFANHN
jgi:hypothetical protein